VNLGSREIQARPRLSGASPGRAHVRPKLSDTIDLLTSPLAHERVTRQTAHRPWALPERSWVMAQTWVDLLFVADPAPRLGQEPQLAQAPPSAHDGLEATRTDSEDGDGLTDKVKAAVADKLT
jgi:hypothetical protein